MQFNVTLISHDVEIFPTASILNNEVVSCTFPVSMSNKVPIPATAEQQASTAAAGVVHGLFTPKATSGVPSFLGHGGAATSVMGNLITNSFADLQSENSSELTALLSSLKKDKNSGMNDDMLQLIQEAVEKDITAVSQAMPSRLDKSFEDEIASSIVPLFESKPDSKILNPVVEKLRIARKELQEKRVEFDENARTYFTAQEMMQNAGVKLG